MQTRIILGSAAAAVALLAGCSSGSGAADATGTNSPQAVAWVDKVCAAMKAVQNAGGTQPQIDQNDPSSAVKGLDAYFGGVVTAVAGARTALQQAGPSPVANADADVTRIEGELGQVATAFQAARDRIKTVNSDDPTALATGMTAALAPVQNLNVASDPIGELRRNPNFDTVAKVVPSCTN